MDYTAHGILQTRILEWVAFPFSRGSSQPRDWTQVSHISGRFLPAELQGKPKNTKVGRLSLLQQIFLAQEIEPGSPVLQADSLPPELSGKLQIIPSNIPKNTSLWGEKGAHYQKFYEKRGTIVWKTLNLTQFHRQSPQGIWQAKGHFSQQEELNSLCWIYFSMKSSLTCFLSSLPTALPLTPCLLFFWSFLAPPNRLVFLWSHFGDRVGVCTQMLIMVIPQALLHIQPA